jgi:hypothetical protein
MVVCFFHNKLMTLDQEQVNSEKEWYDGCLRLMEKMFSFAIKKEEKTVLLKRSVCRLHLRG